MGIPRIPDHVLLVSGLLTRSEDETKQLIDLLCLHWGEPIIKSKPEPFLFTEYYKDEIGESPVRQYIAWQYLFIPDELKKIKQKTNRLELDFSKAQQRYCNIDPGYIGLHQMVLASTKPATYRVYLGEGIYAQSTYHYKGKTFCGWPWTYRDYQQKDTIQFFNRARDAYKKLIE